MPEPIKITRTLFVGLGGTGVKAILRTKQCFMDAYGEIPPMVAFLALDTDRAIRTKSVMSRSGKVVKLTDNEICFCGINGSALEIYRNNLTRFQWVSKRNVNFLANLKGEGAGAVRSNGRFLARHNSEVIGRLIASKVREIGKPLPMDGKFTYDTNMDGNEYPTKINVVGSVAGGTGCGMMLDMLVLIAKNLRDNGLAYSITPWLVLPDVFRHMVPGAVTANVFQNAYGAIRELDYLYHLPKDNQRPLDFLFDKVYYMDEGISDTYLIGNTNKAGVVLQNIDDITDAIGRCMFLPSNETSSAMDDTKAVRFEYNIRNKEAHYVSAGSAEIVYDNQAVGNVVAMGIIAQICDELVKPNSIDAIKDVNTWMSSEAVAIQEHEADLLTDGILSKYAPFGIIIDKEADVNTVIAYIKAGAEADNVIVEVKDNEKRKFEIVEAELEKKLNEILNSQNGIGCAKAFLESLSDNIAVCKNEMSDEASKLTKILGYDVEWSAEIAALRKGILKIFDKDAAEALQNRIAEYIAQKRDLLRHNWALQFFADLETIVKGWSQKIMTFKSVVESVARTQRIKINVIQNLARSDSNFQIYLHSDDVVNFTLPNVIQTSALFRNQTPIYTLINKNEEDMGRVLLDFAKKQTSVQNAVNVSIEQKMSQMNKEQLNALFKKVKDMSSPLWSTDAGGYLANAQEFTTTFTIGVFDRLNNIIQNQYLNDFTLGTVKPVFASTHETDRITFFQCQCYSPAYAVNNVTGYKKEAEEKFQNKNYPVCYIDEKWNQRMNDEGFDLMPEEEPDNVLPNWVNAIVYGLITYDEERNNYVIRSRQGDRLFGGILELGDRRDIAFDNFQLMGIDREVEERLQRMILEQGHPAVIDVIRRAKADIDNYVLNTARLSRLELDQVRARNTTYQMVSDLLEKEITYLEEKDF